MLESPPYVAVISGEPVVASEYVTAHELLDSVHVFEGEKDPVALVLVKLTVPVGELPLTLAVHVVVAVVDIEDGEHIKAVVVDDLLAPPLIDSCVGDPALK